MVENKNLILRKIFNSSETLEIEEEEFKEFDEKIQKSFNEEFLEELAFLDFKKKEFEKNEKILTDFEIKSLEIEKNSEFKKKFKFIQRKIASKIHPDIAGPELEEYFKDFQEAWQKENLVYILKIARELKIFFEIDDEISKIINEELKKQKEKLEKNKKNLKWAWFDSSKDIKSRERVLQVLGINLEEFKEWKKKNKIKNYNFLKIKNLLE
jgi:hypothetical protein